MVTERHITLMLLRAEQSNAHHRALATSHASDCALAAWTCATGTTRSRTNPGMRAAPTSLRALPPRLCCGYAARNSTGQARRKRPRVKRLGNRNVCGGARKDAKLTCHVCGLRARNCVRITVFSSCIEQLAGERPRCHPNNRGSKLATLPRGAPLQTPRNSAPLAHNRSTGRCHKWRLHA
jgi:hypothetical protein